VRDYFAQLLKRVNANAGGSASRISWFRLLEDAPSIDHHEITDKGSINQRAVLARRADLIEALYEGHDGQRIG
jgi:feruloyl-CoA synthase